jgi:hypothetical protein
VKKLAYLPLLCLTTACGAGVPIQLRLDEFVIDLTLDDAIDGVSTQLLPPGSPGLPEVWPDGFPDVCYDALIATDPEDGGQIDLTPDPAEDPEQAELFQPINDGLISRIEIDRLVVRVETNTLNVGLPPIEVQAADQIDAQTEDRRAWRTVGTVGGTELSPTCAQRNGGAAGAPAVEPGEVADLEFEWARGGESFLNAQLADERCLENQMIDGGVADPLKCKEMALRVRTRLSLDTADQKQKPRGDVSLRLILVATFFVDPV